ncbi:acetyltransferase [Ferruginibacter paludis]|uniref:acetyltransferase n=1 Tax=Ferruginibacter paludis TaxID=1310417 RepID=UPI0025B61A2D|nr:acetyltransferase [Ferruginibacter paludis]MDN3658908.1 acetyltransferase [Ferruginibacter paludis]
MKKKEKIFLIGAGETAHLAYEYFTHDSFYEVCGFAVEIKYLDKSEFLGLPVVPFEECETYFPPKEYKVFVAIISTNLNTARTRMFNLAKEKGYQFASYISSGASVWHNVAIGDNCFILSGNVLQPFVKIGDNVILWGGNYIGHRSIIGDNCFLAGHVIIAGLTKIGKNCFLGINSSISDTLEIGEDCFIAMAAVVTKSTEADSVYVGNPAKKSPISAKTYGEYRDFKPKF